VERVVLALDPYSVALRAGDCLAPIDDPLVLSVRAFLERVRRVAVRDESGLVAQARLADALWPAVRDAVVIAPGGSLDSV